MKSVFDFSLRSLGRFGSKNFTVALIFTFLVALLGSVLLITNVLKHQFLLNAKVMPEIIINQTKAGQFTPLDEHALNELWLIPGIERIQGRVWGRYFLEMDRLYVSIVGMNSYESQYNPSLNEVVLDFDFDSNDPKMLLSSNLYKLLHPYMSKSVMPFLRHDGGYEYIGFGKELKKEYELLGNDLILLPTLQARRILGLNSGYTDAIVHVNNPDEVFTIATKIMHSNPHWQVTTRDELIQRYLGLYDYKGGWFLALSIICFVTFAMILYDKAHGLSASERKEIGLLKALGWETEHIIVHKLTEAAIISVGSFLVGFTIALGYVFILEAPLLKHIFTGINSLSPAFSLPFFIDISVFALLFFATVPLYLAASIIPAWRAGVLEAGEVMR